MRLVDLVALCALASACGSSGGSSEGQVGGHCYPNGTCNVGLSCTGGFCFAVDARVPDAPHDSTGTVADAFPCNNDSSLEPNDAIGTAYNTGVASTQSTATYTQLAICPSTDKDYYAVTITVDSQSLQADVTYGSTGAQLLGVITNAGGTPIKTLTSTGTADMISGTAASLPVGTYYVEVYAIAGPNNYSLTLTVTP